MSTANPASPAKAEEWSGIRNFVAKSLNVPVEKVGYEPKPEKDETPPEKPTPSPEAAPEPSPAPVKPVAAKPTAAPVHTPAVSPITPEQVADIAAQAAARVVADAKPKAPDATGPNAELSPDEKRDLEVIERMSVLYPDKYKDAALKYRESIKRLAEYKSEWEKEHPDQEFDQDAEEHSDWMVKNVLAWEEDDFQEAKLDIIADKKAEEKVNKLSERQKKEQDQIRQREEKLKSSAQDIAKQQFCAAKEYLKSVGTDYTAVLKDDGTLDTEKMKELESTDPVGYQEVTSLWSRLDVEVSELAAIMGGLKDFNPNNPVHVEMGKFAEAQEREVMSWPTKERVDEQGRTFLPLAEYYSKPKAEREHAFWTFTADRLAKLRATSLASQASKTIAAQEALAAKIAKARGIELPPRGVKPLATTQTVAPVTPSPTEIKPKTPMAGGGPRMASGRATNGDGHTNAISAFYQRTL